MSGAAGGWLLRPALEPCGLLEVGDQGCADLVHTSIAGSSQDESSSEPALMNASCSTATS